MSSSAAAGISVAIAVPITAIITAIISVAIMYLCTIGSNSSKQSCSPPPQEYKSPVSTSTTTNTTGLEMKSNTAYGQVNYRPTQQTQGAVCHYPELNCMCSKLKSEVGVAAAFVLSLSTNNKSLPCITHA